MRKSISNITSEEFEEYVKGNLSYEGYTQTNEMFVRAIEIMKELEEEIIKLKHEKGLK